MVDTSSAKDAFARRGAPGADRIGSGTDHFKRAADKAAGDRFRSAGGPGFDPVRPKEDAFAKKAGASKAAKPAPSGPAPAKVAAARREPTVRAAAIAPAVAEPVARRGGLHVVPTDARTGDKIAATVQPPVQAKHQPSIDELMFADGDRVEGRRVESERVETDTRQRPAAKTSSLVLVTGGGLATASSVDTLDKPAPVETPPPPPKSETPAPPPAAPERERTGGGGGGAGGGNFGGDGSGGNGAAVVQRKRGIDQDDIAGILFGVVILALLLLWLLRGKDGNEEIAGGDPLLSTQFAATDTGPPETFTPQVDPFGDGVIDLKPKGPIPEAPVEAAPAPAAEAAPSGGTEMALLETAPPAVAAPPPAVVPAPVPVRPAAPAVAASPPPVAAATPTPAALPGLTSHAWFCTGSAELSSAARAELLASIAAFRPHAGEPLVVHAFADTRGTSVYNLALSGARARVVADFLRANGLVVTEFEGKGELAGLADGRDCANQRRADIFFKAGSEYRPSAACVPPEEKSAAICG